MIDNFYTKTYRHLVESEAVIENLRSRWGDTWLSAAFLEYMPLAEKRAKKEGREPTENDILQIHAEENTRKLHEQYKHIFKGYGELEDEELEVAYWVASGRLFGKATHMLFVTNRRIIFADLRALHLNNACMQLEPGESVIQGVELTESVGESEIVSTAHQAAGYRVNAPNYAWVTSNRILACYVNFDTNYFATAGASLEENEEIIGCLLLLGGLLVVTNRKVIHFAVRTGWTKASLECRTVPIDSSTSIDMASKQVVISTGAEQVTCDFMPRHKAEMARVKLLTDEYVPSAKESHSARPIQR